MRATSSTRAIARVTAAIVACERCPRLRTYCEAVARGKRAAYRDETYWGRPVPGFGDPDARIYLLGLAPAAHGANRTGRVFTGDGRGGSGDFLFGALHRAGYASRPTSVAADDGLVLDDVYVGAAVRCAPPANKPTPGEIATCLDHLDAELAALHRVRVVVALGQIAWKAWLDRQARHGAVPRPRPAFGHGAVARVGDGPLLVGCFHPSRQNTHTGRVTPAMYDDLFGRLLPSLLEPADPGAL
ncbi:MAG: uracil-DNA glycosylase [Vicinamibacterales bacterium]